MITQKYLAKIIVSGVLVFGLTAGGGAFAGELGSKEELDLELIPADAFPESGSPESATQNPDVGAAKAAPKAPVTAPPKVILEKSELLKPQVIKAHPIKVEDKPPEAPAPVEARKAVGKKEEIRAVPAAAKEIRAREKDTSIINKWFGLETGIEKMDMRRPGVTEISANQGSGGIYTLSDCIAIAIKNSIPLQIAEKSTKLAQMRIVEARRNMLPSAAIAWEPYSGTVSERNYTGRKQYIEGKQPIYHGGELYYTLKQAETNLEITKNEKNKTKGELILQVKKAYYTLAKAENNQVMQRELSSEVERINQMVNDQYNANVASKLELLNVSSQSSQIKYQLASAEGDAAVADLILKQAMNVEPEIDVTIKPALEFKRVSVDYENTLSAAFVNRPEIIINTLMIEYYMYGKRIALAQSLPKIDIMGSWGLAKENYTPIDNAWMNTGWGVTNQVNITPDQKIEQQWYAGVKGSLPFWGSTAEYTFTREQWTPVVSAFQGTEAKSQSFKFKILDNLAMYSEKQGADIEFDRARQEFVKTKQDVTLEVKEQCFNYQKALIQLDTAANKVKYQSSDLEFIKMKRGLDEVQDSSVIDSMIKLSQERFGYVQALADCHTAIASINKAVGVEDYYKD